MKLLIDISNKDAISAAALAKIGNNPKVIRSGTGVDKDCIIISDGVKNRNITIYFNGSNTKVLENNYEVAEYCFEVYDFLRSIGYTWNK